MNNDKLIIFVNSNLSPSNQILDIKLEDGQIRAKMLGDKDWKVEKDLPSLVLLRIHHWKEMGGQIY